MTKYKVTFVRAVVALEEFERVIEALSDDAARSMAVVIALQAGKTAPPDVDSSAAVAEAWEIDSIEVQE